MEKYLYGASVQGIQGFIFQTNQLEYISGASELVENICTKLFEEVVGKAAFNKKNVVIQAAGNVKYVFDSRKDCANVVLRFPRKVLEAAPGITFSQAVVAFSDDNDFHNAINALEQKLKAQRNRQQPPLEMGMLGCQRDTRTGLPAIETEGNKLIDAATNAKRRAAKGHRLLVKCLWGDERNKPADFKLTETRDFHQLKGDNDWVAIVHIDGNGLGNVVQHLGKDRERFNLFSQLLDKATTKAANEAFQCLCDRFEIDLDKLPLCPVVLGGDDLTVIIRGEFALPYAEKFIETFEQETGKADMKALLKDAGMTCLTACGGIAYIKVSFPFFYGYNLAEDLCKAAKDDAKAKDATNVPSCLMFHKVQDSFVRGYSDIRKRELDINSRKKNDDNSKKVAEEEQKTLCFGPYYLKEQTGYWMIEDLNNREEQLAKPVNGGLKTGIRQWLTLLHENEEAATQRKERLKDIADAKELLGVLTQGEKRKSEDKSGNEQVWTHIPAYDVLALHTIKHQKTNH